MNCDRHGHPCEDGDFQIIDGRILLREGGYLGFDVALMDAAPPSAPVFLTDQQAEALYLDAQARARQARKDAWKTPATSVAAADAARTAATVPAKTANIGDAQALFEDAQRRASEARVNAWRSPAIGAEGL